MLSSEELARFPLLTDLSPEQLAAIAAISRPVSFAPGRALITEGRAAEACWFIRSGQVGLRVHRPGTPDAVVQTLGSGDALGWSWLVPPYRWRFDAVAATPVEAVEIDGVALRELARADCSLGFALALQMLEILADRLHATRARLADVYGSPG
jgi:CRP/FNR family transcriptional regulator, cyclic AMP receptor protein